MKKVFIAALTCFSLHAYADPDQLKGDWVWAAQTHSQTSAIDYLFDKNSAVRTGNRVAYWDKVVAYSPKDGTLTSYGHHIGDCSTQKQAEDASTVEDGKFVSQTAPVWKTYPPNDPNMKMLLAVCRSVH
jgi:hypothetical protein